MSIEQIKVMAKRLADHLASKHGVKLKHSAILEAMAVQFGSKDWNTFIAKFTAEVTVTPTRADSLDDTYLFGEGPDGPCELAYATMRRNTLVFGQRGAGSSLVVQNLLQQQIRKGGGFLYLGATPDEQLFKVVDTEWNRSGRTERLHTLNLVDGPSTCCLNPLAGAYPSERLAEMALTLLTKRHQEWDTAWVQWAKALLSQIVTALRATEQPITFKSLIQIIQDNDALARLARQLPSSSPIAALLDEARNGSAAAGSVRALIVTSLQRFAEGRFISTLNGGAHSQRPQISLEDLVSTHQGLFVTLDGLNASRSNLDAGHFVIEELDNIVASRCLNDSGQSPDVPFLVVIQQANAYVSRRLEAILTKSRLSPLAFVLVQDDPIAGTFDSRHSHLLMANTWNKVFLQQASQESAQYAAEFIGYDSPYREGGAMHPDTRYMAPVGELLTLPVGRAWLMTGPRKVPIRLVQP